MAGQYHRIKHITDLLFTVVLYFGVGYYKVINNHKLEVSKRTPLTYADKFRDTDKIWGPVPQCRTAIVCTLAL
jgi:hypothetical protein